MGLFYRISSPAPNVIWPRKIILTINFIVKINHKNNNIRCPIHLCAAHYIKKNDKPSQKRVQVQAGRVPNRKHSPVCRGCRSDPNNQMCQKTFLSWLLKKTSITADVQNVAKSAVAQVISMSIATKTPGPAMTLVIRTHGKMNHQSRNLKKVLVVDDDPISRKMIAHIFSTAGCIVNTANDGIEALAMVKDDIPDLMTIDLIMPYLRGDRLCQIIREIEPLREITLVIISGVADEAALAPSDFGADACMAKGDPNFTAALIDLVHRENRCIAPTIAGNTKRRKKLSKRTATKELLAVQHRLEFILQNMVEPLFEFTQNGRIVFANQSAVSLAGVSEYKLLGSDFLDLFSPPHVGQIRTALEGNKSSPVEIGADVPVLLKGRLVTGWLVPFTVDEKHTVIAMLSDITARKQAEKALERSRASFHDIVEKNAAGILVLDARDHIVHYANPTAGAFLEQPSQKMIGQPFALPSTTDPPTREIDILRPGNGDHGQAEIRMVDTKWENRPARLITLTDITPRIQLEHGLKAATQVAEQASRAKSEFLAKMSHELRSPLNALLLLAQDLANNKDGNLTADQIESVELIHNSGNILLQLINDILDFSKIDVGCMEVYVTETKLADLVDHAQSLYRHMAESKGLTLNFVIDDALPSTIRTDHQKLEQILRNLIANAIKFTAQGCVNVEFLRPLANQELPQWLDPSKTIAIGITDTGIGIPKGSQNGIFEAFMQADGSISRRYGGTGLGLSISRKLAKLLGGDIYLASTEAKGSTFTLYIPETLNISTNNQDKRASRKRQENAEFAAAVSAWKNASKEPAEVYKVLAGRKILVVDDEARNLFSIAKILESNGLSVCKAINGRKALAILEKEPGIDLVLMDITMPGWNGYETIQRIRRFELFAKLPIITLTAKVMDGDRSKCMSAGADDYLSKPVAVGQLLDAMKRLIK